jgi:hypothetical protein
MRAPFGETRIRYRNRKTAHNQAARRTFAYSHIGPKPIPPCSPSRLVALSRSPDAEHILTAPASGENGTKVTSR